MGTPSPVSGSVDNSFTNALGLVDILPSEQGGSWDEQYDSFFESAAMATGIPFALIKAHGIRESALNPSALRNEPATNSRPPSASYGLMQVLWWQNSNRFASYGYTDDTIGDGSLLYGPGPNTIIGANIMLGNWKSYGNLRRLAQVRFLTHSKSKTKIWCWKSNNN